MGNAFNDPIVWQRAVELSLVIYKFTSAFPETEKYGLTNQLRRAAVSVASNIAEGYGKSTRGEYVQFLGHARGSICEIQTQLVIASRLGFGKEESGKVADALTTEVSKMLVAMIRKLKL
jgi:four helix bundle protein